MFGFSHDLTEELYGAGSKQDTVFATVVVFSILLWSSSAALWGGAIPIDRLAAWQGNVGVQGGIRHRDTIFRTLQPRATAKDINEAIARCPADQVVFLAAGTYNLTSPINITKSEVTLRGAGSNSTFLMFSGFGGTNGLINVSGTSYFTPPTITNITDGLSQFSTVLTVVSSAGFAVGDIVAIDQLNDSNYIGLGAPGPSSGYTVLGNANQTSPRVQMDITEITGITGNQITISPGLYMPNWNLANNPRLLRYTSSAITYSGVENLHVESTYPNGSYPYYGIDFTGAKNCWVKNVSATRAGYAPIHCLTAKNLEIRRCVIGGKNTTPSEVGNYAMLFQMGCQLLIEDNILDHAGAMILQHNTCGSVVGYNFVNATKLPGTTWLGYLNANHNAHPHFNLYEGNLAPQIYSDYIHGSASNITLFRNKLPGWETGALTNTHAITLEMYQRYFNIVGNILGTPSYHTRYEDSGGPITEVSIYKLGYQATYDSTFDSVVVSSLLRHGNYDTVNKGIVWDNGIADHTIPPSLYYASRPAFFGKLAWPAFDPANPNAKGTGIPAGRRWKQSNRHTARR